MTHIGENEKNMPTLMLVETILHNHLYVKYLPYASLPNDLASTFGCQRDKSRGMKKKAKDRNIVARIYVKY